jgi:hypothetical protein
MAYASQAGRARTSAKSPQAHAICDRCGFRYNFVNLKWQFDWRGASLQNLKLLVCNTCYDAPQEQLRAIIVPADPTPIVQARPENYALDSTDYVTTSAPTVYDSRTGIPIPSFTNIVTQTGDNVTTQPVGKPLGLAQGAVMPVQEGVTYGTQLFPLSVYSFGTPEITITFSSNHGLSTNDQISVLGLSNNLANGFFSITFKTNTSFTYQANTAIPSGSLLQGTTRITTAIAGTPWNYSQIVQTGP